MTIRFLFAAMAATAAAQSQYAGSVACRTCHAAIYDRWKITPMANVVRDPKEHPDAFLPDFSKPDPLLTFTKDDVAFIYGGIWKQRYFKRIGDDYYALPAQWDVTHKIWRAYAPRPGTDWWLPFYPDDNMKRPTGPTCDGCHSVNYDIRTHSVTEWNVGCERCHGPGAAHVRQPSRANILNPARLDFVRANDICIQCHSQGRPLTEKIDGRPYDWPVGFHPGLDLQDFWKLEDHKPGETTFTHFADGTAHKNRMQGNDFVQSQMYTHGVTCFSCHDVHGTANKAQLLKPASVLCLECHSPGSPNGPHAASIEQHTHHKSGSSGNECIACHMPAIETTLADANVRAHTFKFISPVATEQSKIPNPCTGCHADQSTAWAIGELKGWRTVSSWRVAN